MKKLTKKQKIRQVEEKLDGIKRYRMETAAYRTRWVKAKSEAEAIQKVESTAYRAHFIVKKIEEEKDIEEYLDEETMNVN